ncbi:MAG: glycoside hydrolase family 38 N-terminal domain-containing protein [Candidatus Nezhaarchaeales archaeon]
MSQQKYKVYFFPHYHYDVVWRFNRRDYSYINHRLLRQVATLCSLFPEFKFGIEDVYQLIEIEHRDPSLFKRLREEALKGNVIVVDGQYLMADTYLPGGEVFAREIMRGKRYVKEKLGIDVQVGWLVDPFGLNPQIPQLYVDAGYKWLVFGRGYERKPRGADFKWRGLDGTEILAHYLCSKHSYHVGLFAEYLHENIEELREYATTRHILMPCGIGSSPFPEWVLGAIERFNKNNPEYEVVIARPEDYFKAIEEEGVELAVEEGEMYKGDRVFDSVWSTRIWIKLEYFKIKNLILNAEKFSTIAWLLGMPYPEHELKEAWDQVLFLAFHDTITGTSIDEVFEEVRDIIDELKPKLDYILSSALNYIASKIHTGKAVVLFNPNGFESESYVEYEVMFSPEDKVKHIELEDTEFEVIEEDRDSEGWLIRAKLGFKASIPPLGYKVYRLSPAIRHERLRVMHGKTYIENDHVRVEVDPLTGILTVTYRDLGMITCRLELENEVGSVYSHRDITRDLAGLVAAEGLKSSNKPVFNITDIRVLEGPLSQRLIVKEELYGCFWPYRLHDHYGSEFYRFKLMDIEKEIRIFRDVPWVEVRMKVKNDFPHIRLRWSFNLDFKGRYIASTAFGAIERKPEPREFPMEDWMDYCNDEKGFALFTRGIPGHQVEEGKVYLTLLRSVDFLSHGDKGPIVPVMDALEINREYKYEFAFMLHKGDWKQAKIWSKALSFTNPPIPLQIKGTHMKGELPGDEYSFLQLTDNAILTCLKKSEADEHIIARFHEAYGENTKATLNFFRKPRKMLKTNITEEKEEPGDLELQLRPYQIVTLKLLL